MTTNKGQFADLGKAVKNLVEAIKEAAREDWATIKDLLKRRPENDR